MEKATAFEWHEFTAGALAIAELVLINIVVVLGRKWKGTRRGSFLDPGTCFIAYGVGVLLLLLATASVCVILWRLVRAPDALGNKDEHIICAVAIGVLWYNDLLSVDAQARRRRTIADHLAKFPTFRFGTSGYKTPVSEPFRNAEFVVRSARRELHDEARKRGDQGPQDYWRGTVARCGEFPTARGGTGGAIVVLHDAATQDEAGAELLAPAFSRVPDLSKDLVADVIWKAVLRSGVWNMQAWESGFATEIVNVLGSVRAVIGMRNGELGQHISGSGRFIGCPDQGTDERLSVADARRLCMLLWAALAVEVFDYLSTGRRMILLPKIVDVPIAIKEDESWTTAALVETCALLRDTRT